MTEGEGMTVGRSAEGVAVGSAGAVGCRGSGVDEGVADGAALVIGIVAGGSADSSGAHAASSRIIRIRGKGIKWRISHLHMKR